MDLKEIAQAQAGEREYLRSIGIEPPGPLEFEDNMTVMSQKLSRVGSMLSVLYGRRGELEGQRKALKDGYETGLSIAASRLEGHYKSVAERHGAVLAGEGEGAEALKDARRLLLQYDALLELYGGYVEGHKIAWDTISRMITVHITEATLASNRHN